MNDDVLVRVENVSKRFCRSLKRSLWYGLQDLGSELGGRRHGCGAGLPQSSADVDLRKDEFWALKDVSFELRRGECLGLIGRNGAGKTTLLRMLNGLIKPDTGQIEMQGSVGALIALGMGFNPLLSGKENIYVNGAIAGLSKKQISSRLDEIIEFSGVKEFIDSPFSGYSSGMQARLGFSVASLLLEPDILLVDEVLAVGDASFKGKCLSRLSDLLDKGTSIIFVSHEAALVERVCSKVLWLKNGTTKELGATAQTLSLYTIDSQESENNDQSEAKKHIHEAKAKLISIDILGESLEKEQRAFMTASKVTFRVHYEVLSSIDYLNATISIRSPEIFTLYCTAKEFEGLSLERGKTWVDLVFPELSLGPGQYIVSVGLTDKKNIGYYDWNWNMGSFSITANDSIVSSFSLPHAWETPSMLEQASVLPDTRRYPSKP